MANFLGFLQFVSFYPSRNNYKFNFYSKVPFLVQFVDEILYENRNKIVKSC